MEMRIFSITMDSLNNRNKGMQPTNMNFDPEMNVRGREDKDPEVYDSKQFFRDIVTIGILVFFIIIPIHTFLFQPFFVRGSSMEPNFKDGEYLVVEELGYKQTSVGLWDWNWFTVNSSTEFNRGESVVFHPPTDDSVFYIKRIIGLPGETVKIHGSTVSIINADFPEGRALDELAYLSPTVTTTGDRVVTLGKDEYYVLGDNRGVSMDSRSFGPIKKDHVIGKVIFRAWPLNRYGVL
jgi:signal peptidase I